jgi:hypothetical protein
VAYFQTKNPALGQFWSDLQLAIKMLIYFTVIWFFKVIWSIFPSFGMLDQEKSGNTDGL